MQSSPSFVNITNEQIYERLVSIEKKLDLTNGKVKLNRWIATTAMTLTILAFGFLFKSLSS